MGARGKQLAWKVLNAVAAAVAVFATKRLITVAWRRFRGAPPEGRKATFAAAATWAAAMGVGAGVARLIAVRLSARAWEAATHEAPPEET